MPRDGAMILSDVRSPTLTIVCERCVRHGRYNVERLRRHHAPVAVKQDGEALDEWARFPTSIEHGESRG
jgi:hypothetical protein